MIIKIISLLVPQILVLVLLVVGGGVVEVVIVILEVAMKRAEVDGCMDGWMGC